ncbi:hypothetical protein DFH09DRAFT_1091822 [Mycena vulgaris]|nr:hypothetical protein DFH09DRAFT_1091822 [Mycena vulgaris]
MPDVPARAEMWRAPTCLAASSGAVTPRSSRAPPSTRQSAFKIILPIQTRRWETMLRLAVTNPEAEGGFRDEFAYASYIATLPTAAGRRISCLFPSTRNSAGCMVILWSQAIHLSYSSVTPRMFLLGDMEPEPVHWGHYNDSDFSRAMEHDVAEMYSSAYGHRYHENSHRRRRFARLILSVPGTLLIAYGGVLGLSTVLRDVLLSPDITDRRKGGEKAIALVLSIMHGDLPLTVLMLRAVLPVEVSPVEVFREGTMGLPRLRWGRRTHQDRATARLDARTEWRWKCGIFGTLLLGNYTLNLRTRFIIAPVMPGSSAIARKSREGVRGAVQGGRNGGVGTQVLTYGAFVPALMGRPEILARLSYADLLWDVVWIVEVVKAVDSPGQ